MRKYALFILLFVSQFTFAALPPTAESMRRIKSIMDSHEVYDKLGSVNWIVSVKEVSEANYEVASEKCTLKVTVTQEESAHEPKIIGPRQLKVSVGELACK